MTSSPSEPRWNVSSSAMIALTTSASLRAKQLTDRERITLSSDPSLSAAQRGFLAAGCLEDFATDFFFAAGFFAAGRFAAGFFFAAALSGTVG